MGIGDHIIKAYLYSQYSSSMFQQLMILWRYFEPQTLLGIILLKVFQSMILSHCIPISISAFPYFCRPHTHTCCPIDLLMKDPNKSSQILNPSWNCRSNHPDFLLVFWVLKQQLKLKFETKKDQANRCHSVYKKPGVGPQMSATFLPHPFWLDYW